MLNKVKRKIQCHQRFLNCIEFRILNLYVEEKFKLVCNNVEEKYKDLKHTPEKPMNVEDR